MVTLNDHRPFLAIYRSLDPLLSKTKLSNRFWLTSHTGASSNICPHIQFFTEVFYVFMSGRVQIIWIFAPKRAEIKWTFAILFSIYRISRFCLRKFQFYFDNFLSKSNFGQKLGICPSVHHISKLIIRITLCFTKNWSNFDTFYLKIFL